MRKEKWTGGERRMKEKQKVGQALAGVFAADLHICPTHPLPPYPHTTYHHPTHPHTHREPPCPSTIIEVVMI